jgi:hypothetical protein
MRGSLSKTALWIVSTLASSLLAAPAQAQISGVTLAWVDQFGERDVYEPAHSVTIGGPSVFVAGTANARAGLHPSYLRRYSRAGVLQWALSLDTGSSQPPVVVADEERVCVGGSRRFTLDVPVQALDRDAGFVRCLDHGGALLWDDPIDATGIGPFPPSTVATALVLTADALYVTGWSTGVLSGCDGTCQSSGGLDAFIRKYVPEDDGFRLAWTRQWGTADNDRFDGLAIGAAGELRLWGLSERTFQQEPWQDNQAIVACYTADGHSCGESSRPLGQDQLLRGAFAGDTFYLASLVSDEGATPWPVASRIEAFPQPPGGVGLLDVAWSDSVPAAWVYGMGADGPGVIVSGPVFGTLPGQASAGGSDAFVRRYSETGATSWTLQFGTAAQDTPVAVTGDSELLLVCGQTTGAMEGGAGAYLNDADGFVAAIGRPDSPKAGIRGLIGEIERLLGSGELRRGQAYSLIGKLQLALWFLQFRNGEPIAAVMLDLFVAEVELHVRLGNLSPGEGGPLAEQARRIAAQLRVQ